MEKENTMESREICTEITAGISANVDSAGTLLEAETTEILIEHDSAKTAEILIEHASAETAEILIEHASAETAETSADTEAEETAAVPAAGKVVETTETPSDPKPGMVKVVGVRFRTAGRIYYFAPGDFPLKRGCHVVVETARGMEYGFVVGPPMEVPKNNIQQPLRPVLRISTREDDERVAANHEREREAFRICRERIHRRGLDTKLIDAEYTFDNSKVLFYFTADGRVDFRELVKDLAGVFRTRIELRQVGVRDETKILGGYGSCGRPLCCHTWLSDFVPVSIKMAKEQNLSLNPGKISGVCGRLMCCLKNETETYEELNKTLPHPGDEVESSDGMNGLVESVNILRQTARIIVEIDDEKELHEYHINDLTILRRRKRGTSRPSLRREQAQKNAAKENAGDHRAPRGASADRRGSRRPAAEPSGDERHGDRKAEHSSEKGSAHVRDKAPHHNHERIAERGSRENGRDTAGETAGREPGRKEHSRPRRDRRFDRRRNKADHAGGHSSGSHE